MGRTLDEMLENLTPAQRAAVEQRADELMVQELPLHDLLLQGLSTEESPLTPADWSSIRKEALARVRIKK